VRSAEVRRSLKDIAGDILTELRPLKSGAGDPRAVIEKHIELVNREVAGFAEANTAYTEWRKAAARALQELEGIDGRVPPPSPDVDRQQPVRVWPGIESAREALAWPLRIKLPSVHINRQQHLCALHAGLLVKQFSEKPVFSRGKNVHRVALLLYEAITGIESPGDDPAKLLRAVRALRHWFV
jgi:hypothetical protein